MTSEVFNTTLIQNHLHQTSTTLKSIHRFLTIISTLTYCILSSTPLSNNHRYATTSTIKTQSEAISNLSRIEEGKRGLNPIPESVTVSVDLNLSLLYQKSPSSIETKGDFMKVLRDGDEP
ncbi:unnamed protein product [Vicia faba]|uniref:Uncharacterized protein n=1 Tax=Vicia faba TaxID=3906 RepID=A0AAV1A505_VICFA|nr:unnamed protein product [Vicia faba]